MAFIKRMLLAITMMASLTAVQANAAIPITYTGSQTVSDPLRGAITATYSITTDGSLGNVNQSNITSYLFTLVQGSNSVQIGTGVGQSFVVGPFFSTSTDLSILVGASNPLNFYNGGYAVQFGPFATGIFFGGSLGVGDFQNNVSFARANTAAVPEPATWAMMLMGFGAIGVSARRRKRRADALATNA